MSLISKSWWQEAKIRFKNKSHDFFKRMKTFVASMVVFGVAGEIIIKYMEEQGYDVPNVLGYICTFLVGYGLATGITAKLTTQDTELSEISRKPKEPEI